MRYEKILKALLLVALIYFPYFLHLGNLPVRAWDEARLVTNAWEMHENGNFLVPHFHGAPDMWNTKPPLMIWLQVLSVNVIGDEELAYRLPSAIAGFMLCILIVIFAVKYLKSYWYGLFAVLALVTSTGHIGEHVARTGDYDSLLTFFMVGGLLLFFVWIETGKIKYLHLFFLSIILSVLTKSVQGLLFLPAMMIYLIMSACFKKFITNKWVWIDTIVVVLVIAGYYLIRESVNPGYIVAVKNNELGGRMLETIEGHTGPFTFYIDLLIKSQFKYYFILAITGIFTGFIARDLLVRRFIRYVSVTALFYLLIISIAKTKLVWYSAPLLPLLAILAAATVYIIFSYMQESLSEGKLKKLILQPALLILVFGYPYYMIIDEVYKPKEKEGFHFNLITNFLKDGMKGDYDLNNTKVKYSDYTAHLEYYIRKMQEKGINIRLMTDNNFRPGDKVIAALGGDKEYLRKNYHTKDIFNYYHIVILQVDSLKQNNKMP